MGLQFRPGFDGYGTRGRRKPTGGRRAVSGDRGTSKDDPALPPAAAAEASASAGAGRLRLVGAEDDRLASWRGVADAANSQAEQLLSGPTDPRWVLAARTAEVLEGPVLLPQRRERLIRLGGVLGLSVFDSNLVIAIVQDQARRGYPKHSILGQAEAQLRMVPLPRRHAWQDTFRGRRGWTMGAILAAVLAIEIALLGWLIWG